jgi:WD40 repeat protein
LLPSPPRQDALEDSLGLPQQPSLSSESTSSTVIAIGSNSKSISLLSYDHSEGVTSGRVTIIDELSGVHNGSVYTLDWSNDSRYLASGSNDKYIRIISYAPPPSPPPPPLLSPPLPPEDKPPQVPSVCEQL